MFAAVAAVAVVCTVAWLAVVRESSEVVKWCDAGCEMPRLAAGFPLGYVYDVPGISIEHQIGVEDEVRLGPMALNLLAYLLLAALLLVVPTAALGVLRKA